MGAFRRLADALKTQGRLMAARFGRKAAAGKKDAERAPSSAEGPDDEWIEVDGGSGDSSARPASPLRPADLRPLFASRAFVLGAIIAVGALVTAIAVSALLSRPLPVMPPLAQGVDLELFSSFEYPDSPLPYAGMEALNPPGVLPPGGPAPAIPEARTLAELAAAGRLEVDDFLEAVE